MVALDLNGAILQQSQYVFPMTVPPLMGSGRTSANSDGPDLNRMCHRPVSAASFAACAVCFSLRAAFRVCHDFCSVFGLGFSFLCDSRLGGVVVDAMFPHFSAIGQARASPVSRLQALKGRAVKMSERITSE